MNFFKSFWIHWKYSRLLKKVYKSENLIQNLSGIFGVQFKMDWVGRIYAVFNPFIKNGQYSNESKIFEYNNQGLDDSQFVETQIVETLTIASSFIRSKNLFDLLTYKIKKLDDYDNYLFIIQPITFEDFFKNAKILMWCLVGLGLLILITLLSFIYLI